MQSAQKFSLQRTKTNIVSFQSFQDDYSCKQRPLFLAQKNIELQMSQLRDQTKAVEQQYQNNLNKIQENHQELNAFIDKLDTRVRQVMDHNEAEILFAYKNHVTLVTKQMEELHKKTEAQANSSSSHLQRIQQLQKQLAIFREQSLILFRKLTEREKSIQELKTKIDELQTEKLFMDQTLKKAIKKNKELQVELSQKRVKSNSNQGDFSHKFDVSMVYMNTLKGKNVRNKNRTPFTSANISKVMTINTQNLVSSNINTKDIKKIQYQFNIAQQKNFGRKLRMRLEFLQPQLLNTIIQSAEQIYSEIQKQKSHLLNDFVKEKEVVSRTTRMSIRSRSNCTVDYNNRPATAMSVSKRLKEAQFQNQRELTFKNQISEYFMKCTQILKKEIVKKKNISCLNFYKEGNPISLNQFKKSDWFRLMELFLNDQRVIQELYKIVINAKQ